MSTDDGERRERRARAELDLIEWARVHGRRDEAVRAAHAAGISQREITEITGIARSTVARILGRKGEGS